MFTGGMTSAAGGITAALIFGLLAASNIKKNSRTYIPYIITCIITAAMFYIINSLSNNESIKKLYGGETILITLGYGTYVTAIFAFIFLPLSV